MTGYSREEEFNRLAPFYDALVRFLAFFIGGEHRFRQRVVALIGLRPGDCVLDVACGTGTMATMMAPCVGSEGQVVGIDFSPQMLEIARRKATMPQLTFRQANAEDIPYYEPRNRLLRAIFRLWMLVEGATAKDLLASGLLKEIRSAGFEDIHQVFIVRDFIPVTLAARNKFRGHWKHLEEGPEVWRVEIGKTK